MPFLSEMTDEELRGCIALQELYRDRGEPDTRACAEAKLHHLYAEIEARAAVRAKRQPKSSAQRPWPNGYGR